MTTTKIPWTYSSVPFHPPWANHPILGWWQDQDEDQCPTGPLFLLFPQQQLDDWLDSFPSVNYERIEQMYGVDIHFSNDPEDYY